MSESGFIAEGYARQLVPDAQLGGAHRVFFIVAGALFVLLVASNMPAPLYAVYRERFGFSALCNNGEARAGDREHMRRRLRAGDGDVHAQTAGSGLAPQLFANRPRIPQQTIETAHVDDDKIRAALVARRKLLRYDGQRRDRRDRRVLN